MKSLILSIGGILLAANIAILMLLTSCTDMVLIVSSSVILATILLIFVSTILNIKDAFKKQEIYVKINGEKLPYDERIIVKEIIG